MGRSPGGLIVAQSHIKMNKLLLALAAGSSEEENQVESFESGLDRETREADPARRQRKNQAKRKNKAEKKNQAKSKNKKGKSNKRKGLKEKRGGKGQKGKRNNRKNGIKNGKKGKKNRKAERNQKKEGKKGNKAGNGRNQNRKNTAEARQCRVTTTCSDTAVAAHKLMKDKVDNFVKQHKRITKKTNIGSKKSSKNDVF